MAFSEPEETKLPLRWIATLSGALDVELAASTGIHTGKDVIRHLLAGAQVTQVVSTIYRNGIGHIAAMNLSLSEWMDEKGYETIEDFRGTLSRSKVADPYAFERAQYVKILMSAHDPKAKYGLVWGNYPVHERPGRVSG